MFDVGFFELILVLLVGFIFLKPEDFATIFYKVGLFIRKIKGFQRDIKKTYQPLLDDVELREVTKTAQKKAAKEEPLTHMSQHEDT